MNVCKRTDDGSQLELKNVAVNKLIKATVVCDGRDIHIRVIKQQRGYMIPKRTSSTIIAACLADVLFAMCTSTLRFFTCKHLSVVLVYCELPIYRPVAEPVP
jgi:hypothetical protein